MSKSVDNEVNPNPRKITARMNGITGFGFLENIPLFSKFFILSEKVIL